MQPYPKFLLRAAMLAAAILSLGAGASACPKEGPPVAKDVPFFGSFVGTPIIDYTVLTGYQTVKFSGGGVVSGMDDVLCSSTNEVVLPNLAAPGAMTADYTITGEGGDTITISIKSTWVTAVPTRFNAAGTPISVHVEFAGTYQVTGGTGRYRNATGGGTFMGMADADTYGGYMANDGPHALEKGVGRWALWGTISGVKEGPCGR